VTDQWLKLYHKLPSYGRTAAASLRGMYLRSWRYGPHTEALIEAARERESWSPAQWTKYREERLARILHRAATRVPYYRHQWATRRRLGYRASWDRLEHWPVLSKEIVRSRPRGFVADDCNPRRMFRERTSGTTGKPLELWRSASTVATLYALSELRERRWSGVDLNDRWAILGGQLVVPAENHKPPFWVWNSALNQLYMSTFHIAPASVPHYLDALQRYQIKYLWGYPSSLHVLAQEVLRLGYAGPKMAVVITNAEPLTERQRDTITRAFGCPVRETYGMAEMVVAASECAHGALHKWPEIGVLEILNDAADRPAEPGTVGRVVGTSLLNGDMPLIRYEIGDRAAVTTRAKPCACGRSLPLLERIEGRLNDLILTPDGRRVYWLNPVFYGIHLHEAQIIQDAVDHVRVLLVPAPGYTAESARIIVERLHARLGRVNVQVDVVAAIARTSGGKFRSVISNLNLERHVDHTAAC
jgi:phenylacetate-CoA ligase